MAIYHFTVTVVSRGRGQRIVAAAAAQSAATLHDEYYGVTHHAARHAAVELAEIRAPAGSPPWVFERELLWNRVEAAERRKDAQLARAVQISLPAELTKAELTALLREFVDEEFVVKGMIADIAIRRSSPDRPSARLLLTLRQPDGAGFGPKVRLWNRKSNLLEWRSAWARCANAHLARAGHRMRIDHRTLEAQQIELAPARKTGVPRSDGGRTLPQYMQDRLAEQREIARDNGDAILRDPTLAIRALTRQRSVFTHEDLVRFLTSRTADAEQLEAALSSVLGCTELAAADPLGEHKPRFTSQDFIDAERSLLRRAQAMAARRGRAAASPAPDSSRWPAPLRDALMHAVGEGDFKAITLPGGSAGDFLNAAREVWQVPNFRVRIGLPLPEDEPLGKIDVLVVEGAEMMELKTLEKLLAAVDRARAKLVLVGDAAQLAAMGSISPMHGLHQAFGPEG